MNFTPYTPADFDNCIALFKGNEGKYFDQSEFEQYQEFLRTEALTGLYYVMKDEGLTVGAGGMMVYDGVYWMDWGMIARDRHGQGIGTQLLQFRLDEIHKLEKNPKIKLCTSQHTVGFYERFGFERVKFTEHGYGPDLHKIEMDLVRI